MTPPRQTAEPSSRKCALALIEAMRSGAVQGAAEVDRLAGEARACALDCSDRLLEAEALLAACRPMAAMLDPQRGLADLQHAERIFLANGLEARAGACRIGIAQCLYDRGEERQAITVVRETLQTGALPGQERAWAYNLVSLCHGRLGELDFALNCVREHALPLANACASADMLAHALLAQALNLIRVVLFRESPMVYRAWPDMPAVQEPTPLPAAVFELFDRAAAVATADASQRSIKVARLFFAGWTRTAADALEGLCRIANEQAHEDPPLAALALYYKGLALRHHGNTRLALEVLLRSLALARGLKATAIVRDSLLQLSRAHETLGDPASALAAYKQFAELRVRSPLQPWPPSSWPGAAEPAPHQLRNLEPAHLKRAVRFIEERLADRLSVDLIARHCGVARRTLETAFRSLRSSSVAEHIRRRRMERAALLLQGDAIGVQEVAEAVGYRSASAFTREFRAHFGVSPSLWRQQSAAEAT